MIFQWKWRESKEWKPPGWADGWPHHCGERGLLIISWYIYLTFYRLSISLTSYFLLFFMFVVQVCRQLGHCADQHWDGYGHNHWGNVSHQFYCVWKADGHFYRELQDVLPQHQRPQSVFTCRHLHEHSKSMCYVLAFLSSRLCCLCISLMSDLTSVRNNTLQDEMRG